MNIQTEKLKLIEWVSRLQDVDLVEKLKKIQVQYETKSICKAEWESIERGIKDIEEGKVHEHSEVRKIYEKYL